MGNRGGNGGIVLQEELKALQMELENFYGQQAEIRSGLKLEDPVVAKPLELIRYEMVKEFGLQVWEGGLMDQPHIWLLQYRVVDNVTRIFALIKQKADEAEARRREDERNAAINAKETYSR